MQIITEIEEYIEFLKKDFSLNITLHPFFEEHLVSNSKLIKYNIHSTPYCLYIKMHPELQSICAEKQHLILNKLKTCSPFTGTCYAGVLERVYGLFLHSKCIGFISVSGYISKSPQTSKKIDNICNEYCLSEKTLDEAYNKLSDKPPDEKLLDSLIIPLCRMIEYGNLLISQSAIGKSNLYINIIRYINTNFCSDISLDKLSNQFNASKSQISHLFKKTKGLSIREYITFLRIELAENLLINTSESITEISLSVGFSDSSYFNNVFKKSKGITPSEYRKKYS